MEETGEWSLGKTEEQNGSRWRIQSFLGGRKRGHRKKGKAVTQRSEKDWLWDRVRGNFNPVFCPLQPRGANRPSPKKRLDCGRTGKVGTLPSSCLASSCRPPTSVSPGSLPQPRELAPTDPQHLYLTVLMAPGL